MAKIARVLMVVMAVVLVVGAVSAQTTTTLSWSTEITTDGWAGTVDRGQDGVVKEYDIPAGFQFMVNGKSVGIADLKPGTMLTSKVTTTSTPHVVQTTDIKNAKVLKVVGSTVIVRMADGEIKKFSNVPKDVTLTSNGKAIELGQLKEGMNLTATIVHESVTTVTETEAMVKGREARKPAPPKAAPAPKPAPAPAVLPSTGSLLPLAGLAGMIMLFAAMSLAVIRRF